MEKTKEYNDLDTKFLGSVVKMLLGLTTAAIVLVFIAYYLEKSKHHVVYDAIEKEIVDCKVSYIREHGKEADGINTVSEIDIAINDDSINNSYTIKLKELDNSWIYFNYDIGDIIQTERTKLKKRDGQNSNEAVQAEEIKYEYAVVKEPELKKEYIEETTKDIIDVEAENVFFNSLYANGGGYYYINIETKH